MPATAPAIQAPAVRTSDVEPDRAHEGQGSSSIPLQQRVIDARLAAQGDLDILDIKGTGPSLSIVHGGGLDRVFDSAPNGVAGPIPVRMDVLMIRNGSSWGGGAVRFASPLQLANVVLANNTASLDGGALMTAEAGGMGAPALTLVRANVHDNAS